MLKLQFFGHLMGRANSLEKILMMGKIKAGGEKSGRGTAFYSLCEGQQLSNLAMSYANID